MKITKKDLLSIFNNSIDYKSSTKFLCVKFDFTLLTQEKKYYTDYVSFINSIDNINEIEIYFSTKPNCKFNDFEINISSDMNTKGKNDFLKRTGKLYNFKIKQSRIITA